MPIANYTLALHDAHPNSCINNLRQIDGAEQQWALETKQAAAAVPAYTDVSSYMRNSVICPSGGAGGTFALSYTLVAVGGPAKPACKIVAATHVLPADTAN